MLCDDCHRNEACIHFTQISPEGKIDKNLCEACAARYQNFVPPADARNFTVNDFLKGLFGKTPEEKEDKTGGGQVCPNCGMTYRDFAHTGKIGCSVCYDTFRAQLAPLLKEQLADAVQSEAYEKAAEYRDKIRELERKIAAEEKGGGADGRA